MNDLEVTRVVDEAARALDPRDDLKLGDVKNVTNFRILLALALEETRESAHPVLEMGLSSESTPHLHDYCEHAGRLLVSVEENILAFGPFMHLTAPRHELRCVSWDSAPIEGNFWSVALVDHAPGDRRWADVLRLAHRCEIIVIHDTEPSADYGYKFSQVWGDFRSRVDVKVEGSCWATAVSNSRDLSVWRGVQIGPYVVSGEGEDLKPDPVAKQIDKFFTTPMNES